MLQIVFFYLNFFHWLKLDLVKLAKLACDQLCYASGSQLLVYTAQFAVVHCTYGKKLLAFTAHMVANC
jgi:hypothetical protein